ncbi:restriction endonuclease subunit S [Pseudooctadecabacter jejudonensis]|uniref:EcoKI restriction-modification system protein HsdS n=1 Tax=Pseudooctadecabacter jejudonensis TaxID=1391910 RepID=A0A1Y5TMW5_9RHOB|nr:restriction endonuclease subunit S [Pseudooctadecabacter jejudonensis]SLN63881.1 EcoKI restriction-modification system protein HsdS [Pseudooctadecabacter jejudonensis]
MVPEGWEEHLLDDSAKRRSGHTPNKKIPDYWNGGIKWVSLADSSALDDGYIRNTDKEISTEGLRNSSAVMLPAETVILSRDAGVGKSAILGEDMAVSQHFIAWTCDEQSKLNNWFLYNWLQMKKPLFERMAVGSTIKTIGLPFFKKLSIYVPPLAEQQKIADILSTWDQAIEKTEGLLSNARTQKRALMKQLLTGKRRFPAFEGQPWKEVRLGDVLDIEYGKSPKDIRVNDGTVPIIGTGGVTGHCHEGFAEGPAIVLGRKGTIDSPRWVEGSFWPIDTTYFCKTNEQNSLRWLFYRLSFMNLRAYNEASGVPSLSRETLRSIRISVPSLDEQRLISRAIGNEEVFEDICRREVAHLRTEKKALMQQLLTGKRRVVV